MQDAQRVILAGIGEERLDLFLLLNANVGYRVVGVVDSAIDGESARIAEIMGVKVYQDRDAEKLPRSDVLIYGDDRYRDLGGRLGIKSSCVWHENHAWDVLAEADATDEAEAEAAPVPAGAAAAEASGAEHAPRGGAPGDTATSDSITIDEHVSIGADGVTREDDITISPPPQTSEPAAREPEPASEPEPAPASNGTGDADRPAADTGDEPTGPAATSETAAGTTSVETLAAFMGSLTSVRAFYAWLLDRAIALTGAVAGGVHPGEATRPTVWRDRRTAPGGAPPSFLTGDAAGAPVMTRTFGGETGAGNGKLVLLRAAASDELDRLLDTITPALALVAEREDLRGMARLGELDGALHGLPGDREDPIGSLAPVARSVADELRAREAMFLFAHGEQWRGVSSSGHAVQVPMGSGLVGDADAGAPRQLVESSGARHYVVPLGHDPSRRGVLALFGVEADAGEADAVAERAGRLAAHLADRMPAGVWEA